MKWRYAVASALGVVLTAVILIGWLVVARADEVLGTTFVGPIDASGLTEEELISALADFEEELAGRERVLSIDGTAIPVLGDALGFSIDEAATAETALSVGRDTFWETISSSTFAKHTTIEPVIDVSDSALEAAVAVWNESVVENQPFNGSLSYHDGMVSLDPPRPGVAVAEEGLEQRLVSAFLGPPEDLVILGTRPRPPTVEEAEAAAALERAEEIVSGTVILRSEDPSVSVAFTPEELGDALVSSVDGGALVPALDPDVIAKYLEPVQAQLEAPPRDAEIAITEDDEVVIVPSRPGGLIDSNLVVESILEATQTPGRTGELMYVPGAQPAFTTEDAEELGIKEKVSEFTTFHACCQPRVTNIHQIADIVDGAIVMPGEEFDVNEFVGPRTREKGFVPAPMILRGRFVDSVGGGISQFATTLYNAVFFGGYTDVTHQPHSYYFSRYPEGREATVSYPQPDLIFRNDTDAALLIKTEYPDTEITVKFFGDNGGLQVDDGLSPRRRYRNPVTEYQPDSSLEPGAERVVASGSRGWDVTVTRTITYPDGEVTVETWDERYLPQPRIVRRHPCSIPGSVETCPTTTTTSSTTTTTIATEG